MVAVYAAMSVLMEVPSGVLADRWSRKGVLALGAACLALSSLLGGLSYGLPLYILSVLWGFYDAFNSGTDSAIIYDILREERGHDKDYEKEFGIYSAVGGAGLFFAGLLGGLAAQDFGLRETYFLPIPAVATAIICVLFFRDSTRHRQSQESHIGKHLAETFGAIFKNPTLVWVMVTMFTVSLTSGLVGEMYQLWYIAIAAPVLFFGVAAAMINATWGCGGLLARFLTTKRTIIISLGIVIVSAITLAVTHNSIVILAAQFLLVLLLNAVWTVMTGRMHRQLPSHVRAGAGSAANTAMRLINIPLVLIFGWVAHNVSIFAAAWIVVGLVVLGLASEVLAKRAPGSRGSMKVLG